MARHAADLPVSPIAPGQHGFPHEAVVYLQRARVFQAAVRVTTALGYAEAYFDRIHQPTGITKATLYTLYPNREELVVDAMWQSLTFGVAKITRAFDAHPDDPAAALTAAVDRFLDVATADPAWTEFTLLEAVGAGAPAWAARDVALAPIHDRLRALTRMRKTPTAPTWIVDAAMAALRPAIVGGNLASAAPDLKCALRALVCTMCGIEPPKPPRRRQSAPARASTEPQLVDRINNAFAAYAVTGDPAVITELAREAVARRHGPAQWQAIRRLTALPALGLSAQPPLADVEGALIAALSDAWPFGTPLTNPGAVGMTGGRLRVLEALRAAPGSSRDDLARRTGVNSLRLLDRMRSAGLIAGTGTPPRDRWSLKPDGLAALEGEPGAP